MFQRPILRNEEGASPGGGAPQHAATPAEPQAQGEAPVTIADLKAVLSGLKSEIASELKNGIHADLRRAGVYGKSGKDSKPNNSPNGKSNGSPGPAKQQSAAPRGEAPMTASQVNEMMARERAFTRVAASANLTEDQFRVVEDTFRAVNPPDPAAWASGFLGAMGIGKKNPTNPAPNAATQATKPSPSNTPPARVAPDLGSPAPGDQRDAEAVLLNRPLEANLHDFERLVVQHGRTKALEMWASHVKAYLGGVRVVPDNRRQR